MKADVRTAFVDASVTVQPGEVVAVVGPNGAGKTSLLRALAGLVPADGTVEVAGRQVAALPPYRRGIGWVPQGLSLFGHLSAVVNAAYALRSRGARRGAARAEAQQWLERLDVGDLAQRRPYQLSGGQQARVGLARALAGAPDLLLLDEPLAALDSTTRDDVRRLLRRTLAGGPAAVLLVTHDPVDVVSLADRMLVLEEGRVVQEGTPVEVAASPRSSWAAALLGQNAWRGTTDDSGLVVEGVQLFAAEPLPPGMPALALCEPSSVTLHRARPRGSARNVLTGEVGELRSLGGRVRVVVRSRPEIIAEVTVAAAVDLALAEAGPVFAAVKATELRLVPL